MPDNIPLHYATEFSTNWIHRVQQTKARFDAFVEDESFLGERKRYDRLYKQSSRKRTERKAPTPVTDPGNDSRWCYRQTFDLANMLAEEDARNLGQLVLPTSDYVKSHTAAYNRDADLVAYQAARGNAIIGQLGTETAVLPSEQKIAVGGVGLTLAKLQKAVELLNAADIGDEESRILVVGPRQISDLLGIQEATSADYNTVRALASGAIDTFMGFKFVISNQTVKETNTRYCVAWVKGAIKRVKGGMRTTVDRLPDKSNATQIYSSWDLSATRVYDEGVVEIACNET